MIIFFFFFFFFFLLLLLLLHNQVLEPAFGPSPPVSLTGPRGRAARRVTVCVCLFVCVFVCVSRREASSAAVSCTRPASACLPCGPAGVDVAPTRIQQPEPTRSDAIPAPSRPGRRSFSLRSCAALARRLVPAGALLQRCLI